MTIGQNGDRFGALLTTERMADGVIYEQMIMQPSVKTLIYRMFIRPLTSFPSAVSFIFHSVKKC